ncbi:endocuticle structural glycoprotein SgAbd-9 [Halyomorpha halys]|uniref:endocuticle structural glycoprotein SgAbd-9 n=1 Tax=Halyomorpha halys TaxID=286706 RepID=UPI0006D5098C|nr:endocuticle structural glycoprotein SgAbd-9 [Halyomorpha halys]KAE8573772.1 Cuticle Protein CPR RR-1 [Halyomorpha halys]
MISLVALCFLAGAFAAPQYNPYYNRGAYPNAPGAFVPIVSQHYDLNPDQSYTFEYTSADGSSRQEQGVPRVPGPEGPAVTVQGAYGYQSPEGPVQVSYVADENGYQPSGPGIHPAILKSVAVQVAEARGTNPYPGQYPGAYPGAFPGAYRPY